jgi:Glycosyl hydrolase family 20, catalytic domain
VNRPYVLLIFIFLILSCSIQEQKQINGIMIDCSRLIEKQEYYYRLVDFMSDWNMNTLLLHFSDDHGISIKLPGYEKLAVPHAFTRDEIIDLIDYAEKKKIEIIPELEVFGHTRYITDHPDYHHLYVGDRTGKIVFNAVDPTNPETVTLMRSMISELAAIFPTKYLHLGCDEVNLDGLGLNNKEKEAQIWVDYVNKMIAITKNLDKTPMMWNDHVRKDPGVAEALDKDVVLVEWNYNPQYSPTGLDDLKKRGFTTIMMAPSVSCWRSRVIPTRPQLSNVDAHAEALRNGIAEGLINTVWLPMRYLQNSMWYGMAYSAWLVNSGKPMDLRKFHKAFARKTFDLKADRELHAFLDSWTLLHLDRQYFSMIATGDYGALNDPEKISALRKVRDLSKELISNRITTLPKKNPEILESMYLSAEIIYVLSEGLLLRVEKAIEDRQINWMRLSGDVISRAESEWDDGRYPDDPAKYKAKFPNQTNSHLLIVLRKLRDLDSLKI